MNKEAIRERIWLITDGVPLQLGNMTLKTNNSHKLIVTGWTYTIHFEKITRKKVLKELTDLKNSFSELRNSFSELNDLVNLNKLTIEYHMAYDDAGKAGIGLCSEIDETINWYIEK